LFDIIVCIFEIWYGLLLRTEGKIMIDIRAITKENIDEEFKLCVISGGIR